MELGLWQETALKSVLVTAPLALRETLRPQTKPVLIDRYAGLRPGSLEDVTAAIEYTCGRWRNGGKTSTPRSTTTNGT